MPNKKQNMTATKNNMAAQQRGRANMAYQSAKVKASKNIKPKPKPRKKDEVDSAAQKTGKAKSTSSISKANLILNPNKEVFKPINVDYKSNMKLEKVGKSPEMAAQMKGDYAAKMSDTDMGIEYRFGKQATADVKAAQQKGNPIMPDVFKKKEQYHTSGMPNFITSAESGEKMNTMGIDEGNFSKITTNIPERSKVTATEDSDKYQKGEEFFVDPAKMQAQHPSKKRMADMVTKVTTYNMPNVKAAQKKYHK